MSLHVVLNAQSGTTENAFFSYEAEVNVLLTDDEDIRQDQ